MNSEINNVKIRYYILLALIIFATVVTPHFVHGYGPVSEKYAQSLALIFNLVVAFALWRIYKKQLSSLAEKNQVIEQRLLESFKYIGKVHGRDDLLADFLDLAREYSSKAINEKVFFNKLLCIIVISVVKADFGILQFVAPGNRVAIKNYVYVRSGKSLKAIPHSANVLTASDRLKVDGVGCVAVYGDFVLNESRCVLLFPQKYNNPDLKLLKVFVNQAHLFFVTAKMAAA